MNGDEQTEGQLSIVNVPDTNIGKMSDIPTGAEVLDKIRAEIDSYCSDNRDRNDGLYIAMRIIDKYKASPTGAEGSDKE